MAWIEDDEWSQDAKRQEIMQSKRDTIVDYYVVNMLDEPETIRDALDYYFSIAPNADINSLYKDLFGNLDRR